MSFSVNVDTKISGRLNSASRNPLGPSIGIPPGSVVVGSTGWPVSVVRQRPIGSKFSRASPVGSMIA
jgi:hypothetical protein